MMLADLDLFKDWKRTIKILTRLIKNFKITFDSINENKDLSF